MVKYLTEVEFRDVRNRIQQGEASIRIPRSVSRQFFTHVTNRSIIDITESSALLQKILIWSGIASAWVLLAICAGLVIESWGIWATVVVPLVGAFWAILAGFTHEQGSWQIISLVLVATLIGIFTVPGHYVLPLFFFVLSLWTHRMTYILAQRFLEKLVTNSFDAWDMLVEHIELNDPAQQDQADAA